MRVTGGPSGREEVVEMTYYEACIHRIALAGASGNRIAARAFVEMVMQNSIMIERNERMEAEKERRLGLLGPEADAYLDGAGKRRQDFVTRVEELYRRGLEDDGGDPNGDFGGTREDPLDEG